MTTVWQKVKPPGVVLTRALEPPGCLDGAGAGEQKDEVGYGQS